MIERKKRKKENVEKETRKNIENRLSEKQNGGVRKEKKNVCT